MSRRWRAPNRCRRVEGLRRWPCCSYGRRYGVQAGRNGYRQDVSKSRPLDKDNRSAWVNSKESQKKRDLGVKVIRAKGERSLDGNLHFLRRECAAASLA